MFKDLLENQVFRALSISTKLSGDCATVDVNSNPGEIESIIKRASKQHDDYDNIVVKDGLSYIGFINREELANHIDDFDGRFVSKMGNYALQSNDNLATVINRLKEDSNRSTAQRLYFVLDRNVPVGLFTYSDLNRRSVYIYFYTLILFLEQWIREKIADNHRLPGRKLDPRWMNSLSQKERSNLHELSISKGESTLSVAGLNLLIKAYKKDGALAWTWGQHKDIVTKKLLNFAEEIRPKVMHPTKLLVPRNRIFDRLKSLQYLSTQMRELIQREDFNTKNGGWASR